ncbi:MAG: energy-coupled thiamine transporter ThiT [Firmicutes bacterium]|nr:energy-coupled thiamine transporter ThiT [Bacillota bacterium]
MEKIKNENSTAKFESEVEFSQDVTTKDETNKKPRLKAASTRTRTEATVMGGLMVSLAIILDFYKLAQLPQGGSITIVSFLPLCLYAFVYGWRRGLVAGLAYGLLDLLTTNPAWLLHPIQIALDYIVPSMTIALCGVLTALRQRGILSKDNILRRLDLYIGIIVVSLFRFFSHFLAGIIFWIEFTPAEFWSAVWLSASVNSIILIDMSVVFFVAILITASPVLMSHLRKLYQTDTMQGVGYRRDM